MTSMVPLVSSSGHRKRSAGALPDGAGENDSSGSSALDSMRPVTAPRKRRRTFLDAFQNITLQKNSDDDDDGCDDADSSQAVADEDYNDIGDADNFDTTSSIEDPEDEDVDKMLLSDREEAERKVMFELVFGPEHPESTSQKDKDIVDRKLQELIRSSLRHVKRTGELHETEDDMTIDTPYSRSSTLDSVSLCTMRTRSNSLPNLHINNDDETMDTFSS